MDCGLEASGLSVKYEDYLQSIEIVIAPSTGATQEHFPCIKEAAGHEIVTFEDRAMYSAYTDFTVDLARPEMLVSGERRLKELGLWDGFPDPKDFDSLDGYAEALEAHAGLVPGSTLRVSGESILFDPRHDFSGYDDFANRYGALLAVIAYASARDRLGFGFVGNELVAD